ncbi:hypothetical protein SLEP1_g34969 [Rubroshorea leprosula]|uniref:Uncharacterized protein n=1 Tax=Rubroshorea leprosula TaxID=152421 RepID=A0AAV5KM12_9ROSI|nr:hypothetical protein SLEP1_g34969 [Rubroshorea leprosula]
MLFPIYVGVASSVIMPTSKFLGQIKTFFLNKCNFWGNGEGIELNTWGWGTTSLTKQLIRTDASKAKASTFIFFYV